MALPVNIKELINGRTIEWERLEFKKGWNPEDVLHTLCAFANDINNWGGGYIFIGIAEQSGRPVLPPAGLSADSIDRIQMELTQLCHKMQPNYLPIVQPYLFMKKHILIIHAPAGDMRPYTVPEGLGEKGVKNRHSYIRTGSSTIRAMGENLRKLQELTARIPFDDRIHQTAELQDLNLGLIRSFLQEIKSDLLEESTRMPFADLCRHMQLARGPEELLRPVNVGLLFFSSEPHRFFSRAWIEVVIRKDEAGKDFTEKYFKGPIHLQLREALSFIKNQVIVEFVRKISGQAEAVRYYNFPYEAVEEALANAVYHKSYELGKPIEVQVWPDKIEILSFPGPVPPISAQILAENKRIVARDYRNRRVGDFLKELRLTEGRGTGIPTIKRSLKRNQSPEPIFETDEQCLYFLTVLAIRPVFYEEAEIINVINDDHDGSISDHDKQKSNHDGLKSDYDKPKNDYDGSKSDYDGSKGDHDEPESDRDSVKSDYDKPKSDRDRIKSDRDKSKNDRDKSKNDRDKSKNDRDKSKNDRDKSKNDRDNKSKNDRDKSKNDRDGQKSDNDKPESDRDRIKSDREEPKNDRDKSKNDRDGQKSDNDESESDRDDPTDSDKELVIAVLSFCENAAKRDEIFRKIGFKNHSDNFNRHIKPMILNGWIAMTIPEKPSSKNQRYITTTAGKEVLEKYSKGSA